MMEANLVTFYMRRMGSALWIDAEQVEGGKRQFGMSGVQRLRVNTEREVLQAIDNAGIGHWSSFPPDGIQATVTRTQLKTIGFRGNY
jgi:hypothetical protein